VFYIVTKFSMSYNMAEFVFEIIPNLSCDSLNALHTKFNSLGVQSKEHLAFVQLNDLQDLSTSIQARKLVRV